RAELELLSVVEEARDLGDALLFASVTEDLRAGVHPQHVLVAADVIAVVVRAQDGREGQAHALDGRQHGRALAGGDEGHLLRPLVDDQVRVVVGETRNRLDAHAHPPLAFAASSTNAFSNASIRFVARARASSNGSLGATGSRTSK